MNKISIPSGWRKMSEGEIVLKGDKYFGPAENKFVESYNYPEHHGKSWKVGSTNNYTYIRKIN